MQRPHVTVLSGLKSSECLCERPVLNSQSGYFSKVSFLNRSNVCFVWNGESQSVQYNLKLQKLLKTWENQQHEIMCQNPHPYNKIFLIT